MGQIFNVKYYVLKISKGLLRNYLRFNGPLTTLKYP
jgi:hypothetical protein